MNGNGLNTLEYVQKLEKAGIPRKQAEAQASILYDVIHSSLATKRDTEEIRKEIEQIRAELKRDIEGVRTELKQEIEAVRTELKRDIEGVRIELKRDIKELEARISLKMVITSGSFAFLILGSLVTLAKLGLLTP